MKVAHICTQIEKGGAAQATANLHLGLRNLGVESTVLSLSRSETIPYSECYSTPVAKEQNFALSEVSYSLIWKRRTEISNTHFSTDLFGYNISRHPLVLSADVLHLHWVAEFLSSASLVELAVLGKPLFWTLHDMRPLTGGCHFSNGCNRFTETCGKCPQLSDEPLDFTAQNLNAMASAVAAANMEFIAPSEWMLQNIRKSRIAREAASHYIPYSVDTHIFHPVEKQAARSNLHLEKDVWYILFATHSLDEIRKGGEDTLAILEKLRQHPTTTEAVASGKMRILCCGEKMSCFSPLGWKIEHVGYLPKEKMALFYNSADALLFTSLEDNLPNVLLEAMACGTPIVSYRVGGAIDLLNSPFLSDSLVEAGNTTEAAMALIRLFQNKNLSQEFSFHATERIKQNYSLEKQASAYLQLYTDSLTQLPKKLRPPVPLLREGSSEAVLFAIAALKADDNQLNDLIRQVEQLRSRVLNLRLLLDKERNNFIKKAARWILRVLKYLSFSKTPLEPAQKA